MLNIDERKVATDIHDVVGDNIYRLGVIADGTCLLHCVLYARCHEYRRVDNATRKKIAESTRAKLSKKPTAMLSECGFKTGADEGNSRREIADVSVYMDERHIQLLMVVYDINIWVTQDQTGDVACSQSRAPDTSVDMRRDMLNSNDCDTVFVYMIDKHFELLFFSSQGYNKYTFGADDPITRLTRERYAQCCAADTKKRGRDCFPKYRDLDTRKATARRVKNGTIIPRNLTWEQLLALGVDLGVHTNILTMTSDTRDIVEEFIKADALKLLK